MQDNSLQDDRCKLIIFKIVHFERLQVTSESVNNEMRTDLKELLRPHKLPQGALAKSVESGVKISKTCLPLVSLLCLLKSWNKDKQDMFAPS